MARSHREVLIFVPTIIILHVGAVVSMNCDSSSVPFALSFCSDQSVAGRIVYLSGIDNRTNGIGCNCSISLTSSNQYPAKIEIKNVTTTSNLCDYSLYSVYRNTTTILYFCGKNLNGQIFGLKPMETVRLHIETGTYNAVGFPFCLQLSSGQGSNMKLQCRAAPQSTTTTTTYTSPSTLTSMKSSNTSNLTTTIYDTQNIPISSTWRNEDATKPLPNDHDSDRLIGIIIGSIITLLVVVATLIITVCLVKRRKKDIIYETPQQPQQSSHIYTDLHVEPVNTRTQQNNIYVNSVVI